VRKTAPAEAQPKAEPKNITELQEKLADKLMRIAPYFVYFEGFNDRLPKKKYIEQIANRDEFGYQAVQDFIKLAEIDIDRLKIETDDKNIDNYLDGKSANVTGDFLTYWTQKVDGVSQVKIVTERKHDDKGYYLNFL